MAALDLNNIRATIETRLVEELQKAPIITKLLVLKIMKLLYNV